MARRSLKPQLNQIRTWVRQGRTDAWIAHQLEVAVKDIDAFKRDHELVPVEAGNGADATLSVDQELDLRAEDEALIAAELEAEPDEDESADEAEDEGEGADEPGDASQRQRRRGRRGRRGGRGRGKTLEGSFDHGEEGYGLWLDPAVQKDAVYLEHWAGHRAVTVTVEPDRIVIRRGGDEAAPERAEQASSADPDEVEV